jgi:hypothetical protein
MRASLVSSACSRPAWWASARRATHSAAVAKATRCPAWPQSDSQSGEFAVDASVPPGRVLGGQPQDQLPQLWWGASAAGAVASGLGPASLDQIQVPPQDRGRGDDPMQSACSGQQPGQHRQHRPYPPTTVAACSPAGATPRPRGAARESPHSSSMRCEPAIPARPGPAGRSDIAVVPPRPTIMPDGHGPTLPQATPVDDQFGTHRSRVRSSRSRRPSEPRTVSQPLGCALARRLAQRIPLSRL